MTQHVLKVSAGSMVTLYNMQTGKSQLFHGIDAQECMSRGGWSLAPAEELVAEPAPTIDTTPEPSPEPKPKKGR